MIATLVSKSFASRISGSISSFLPSETIGTGAVKSFCRPLKKEILEQSTFVNPFDIRHILTGWLLAFGGFIFCILGLKESLLPKEEVNRVWAMVFTGISKPIWALSICWIIYANVYNCAGLIGSFLSIKYLVPLSRISYCVYLVHVAIQFLLYGTLRTSMYFSNRSLWLSYLNVFVLSIITGFIFTILFESPIITLEKLIFKKTHESQSKTQHSCTTENNVKKEEEGSVSLVE